MSSENIEKKCLYWLNLAQSYILVGDIKNALRTYFLINQAFINPVVNKYPKGAPVSINSGVNPRPQIIWGKPGLKVRGILKY